MTPTQSYPLHPVSRRHRRSRRQHLHRLRYHRAGRLPADGGFPFRALGRRELQTAPAIAAAVCRPIRRQRQMNSLVGVNSSGPAQSQPGGGICVQGGAVCQSRVISAGNRAGDFLSNAMPRFAAAHGPGFRQPAGVQRQPTSFSGNRRPKIAPQVSVLRAASCLLALQKQPHQS